MSIKATKREEVGTSASKKARDAGLVPANIYGKEVESLSVLINLKELEDKIREVGMNGVFTVDVENDASYNVFVKEFSKAALKQTVYHVDLLSFKEGEKVSMTIPIVLHGEEAVKEGFVSLLLNELEVEVAPSDAPEEFVIDASEFKIGDTLTVADLKVPAGVEVITELDYALVTVSAPEEFEEPEVADEDAEMPEPEVIGEDEEEEEK